MSNARYTAVERTRVSLGSQLRVVLDAMKEKGQINGWEVIKTAPSGCVRYYIEDGYGRTAGLTPGEATDWVNAYGYGVRIGRTS